ncbi:N-acetylmuramoyl-L-alanine amidase family protein [Companilactobacillus kimchiensis]|uniref:Amidase n=1 Tax=Companilactobacillus kimchiensis TaxID=993692 RepID=A0A0R2LJH2_9LACO|nr:peptidoglycan recognition family protein [Companilactobacillus kimchiensis]KRN99788.1 amidase [Companilactobacillus kimchiensis]
MNKKRLGLYALLISMMSAMFLFFNVKTVNAMPVNDYIISNKIQPAAIQNREGTFNDWTPYENGVGKPEGIVIHETADNRASAEAEYTFFNNNWNTVQTYVHAVADDTEIINMHNTDYGVWGAGPTANAKFIQIELCRTHTGDAFARSIANDAFYAASKLIQYNLPDTPGVTVMSHHQTSIKWGETTHVDPDTYFPMWGYSMNEMNDMIGYYYNNLKNTGSVYGGNGTNSPSNTPATNNANTINVANSKGNFVPLVTFDSQGNAKNVPNRALANHSAWYTDMTKDANGVTYHRVSTNEWVSSAYIY